jgi:uncharacterized membrane protein
VTPNELSWRSASWNVWAASNVRCWWCRYRPVPAGSSAKALRRSSKCTGDTAIVATQYSYLASLIAGTLELERATEAEITLFSAVRARWSQLPPEHRPKLVLFAKSLGTAGVEAPFVGSDASASLANLVSQTDGALVVGAPYDNPILGQLTRERTPGSPVWLPVFDNGRSVRFVNRDPRQPELDRDWAAPRIVYLQHPSDRSTFWGFSALWTPPAWMD